jgi:ComF family protein
VRRLGRALIDLLLPEEGCAICAGPAPRTWRPQDRVGPAAEDDEVSTPPEVCPTCLADIFGARPSLRRPAPSGDRLDRAVASRWPSLLDGVVTAGVYSGSLEKAVLRLKRTPDRRLSRFLARLLVESLEEQLGPGAHAWTALAPVPLHSSRLRERGFNQAALLAHEMATVLRVPVWARACERVRLTPLQSALSRPERLRSVRGAFRPILNEAFPLPGSRLLIIDDVVTTGATAAEVARALRAGGAREVWCAAVAGAV